MSPVLLAASKGPVLEDVSAARRLRVCLYYPWLYLTSGSERTILEIARRSRHSIQVVTNEYQPEATYPELATLGVKVLTRVPVDRSVGAVGLAAWRIWRQRLDVSAYDALLVVCEGLGDLVALRHPDLPAFCVCLTPLRIAFDPEYRREYFRGKGLVRRAVVETSARAFAAVDRIAWRRYRRIFPISQEVARRIEAGGLAPVDRLQVAHPGVDLDVFASAPARERVFLVPGRIMWTKNLELAIDAFRLFRTRIGDPSWRLRITGIVDRKSEPYVAELRRRAAGDRGIEFVVHPSDDALRAMYRDCFATLFTAFNEDWGLVIVEALASGKPVVACNRGGPREIVRHNQDGLLAAGTPEAFADAMCRLVTEPHLYERLVAAARPGAARFRWDTFVRVLDDGIEAGLQCGDAVRDEAEAKG